MVKKKPVDAARARGESGAATGAAAPRLSRGASARKGSASSAAGVPQKKNAVPDVGQGKMTWSMHVPSQGDFHPSEPGMGLTVSRREGVMLRECVC